MKVAIVCDWLVSVGGAERVLRSICDLFPKAPIYTSQYNKKGIDWFNDREVHTGWLQIVPSSLRRFIGLLRQCYFNHLDLSSYDLIISVTGAEAKSVKKGNAIHICYCHVPTQYYWGLKDDYIKNPGFGILNPVVRLALKAFLPPLKKADYAAAQRPDEFITISSYAQQQIKSAYKRESTIIHPPVAVEKFSTKDFSTSRETIKRSKSQAKETEHKQHENAKSQMTIQLPSVKSATRHGFVATSRQVTWKRLDLAIKACMELKVSLTIIGEGPEHNNLVRLANGSEYIKFVPLADIKTIKRYLEQAEGFIFPSLEPFGIAPVEALACGCPVIAYGNGGALDYIKDGKNGVLFDRQTVSSLSRAIEHFQTLKFDEVKIRESALPFSEKNFQDQLMAFVTKKTSNVKDV
ncbi:glycosyltransferase [Candidatus Saccharibacteria bacterium]|nr:glycosyltransferase [Candidatus Saccharibacteria bacterium]